MFSIVSFGCLGISYTTREKIIDLGPVQMTADKTRNLLFSPIVSGAALIGDIVLQVM